MCQSQLPSLPAPGLACTPWHTLPGLHAWVCAHHLPAASCVLIGREVCPWENEPREGAGIVAENGLRPFELGVLESWVPRMWSRRGYQAAGGQCILGLRGYLACRRGTAGGGGAEKAQPFRVQGLGPGPYLTGVQKILSLCASISFRLTNSSGFARDFSSFSTENPASQKTPQPWANWDSWSPLFLHLYN